MTDIYKAAQMALEALENFARFQRMMMDGPDASDKLLAEDYAEAAFLQGAQAIPALRAALAQQQEPVQPVAWRVHPFDYGIGHEGVYATTHLTEQRDAWLRKGWNVESLYTAPPAPEARKPKAQPQVPEGYALIGITALKAWGKYDEVVAACQYKSKP